MPDPVREATAIVANLLTYYSFEPGELTPSELSDRWLSTYPVDWVRLALIEAVYQGRYKPFSVEQLLAFWQRRGQPLYHFNHEFERLVCSNFPQRLQGRPPQPKTVTRPQKPSGSEWFNRGPTLPQTQPKVTTASHFASQAPRQPEPQLSDVPSPSPSHSPSPSLESLSGKVMPTADPVLGSLEAPGADLEPLDSDPQSPDTPEAQSSDVQLNRDREPLDAPEVEPSLEPGESKPLTPLEIVSEQAEPVSRSSVSERFLIHEFIPATAASGVHSKLTALIKDQSDSLVPAEQEQRF